MWKVGVILLLALGAVVAYDAGLAAKRVTDFRIRSQNLHVEALEHEVEELEHEFDSLSKPLAKAVTNRLKARVRKVEGSRCEENEVSCGGTAPQCISDLFVCDGRNDCINGHDEDDSVCSMDVVRVGSTFQGVIHWTACETRPDHNVLITITESHRTSDFGARAILHGTVTSLAAEGQEMSSYTAHGYFLFAKRKLVLIPDPDSPHPLSILCFFHFGDHDHADCQTQELLSKKRCARFRVGRA